MCLLHRLDSLGGDHQAHQGEPVRAGRLQLVEGVHGAAAGGEHRVDHEHVGVGQAGWQALVVVDRAVLLLVAVDAHVADAGAGEETQEAVDHPQAGAQHRHDRDLGGEAAAGGPLERGLHLHLRHGQAARGLDGQDRRGLEQGLAEVAVAGVAVAHDRQAVGENGVVHDGEALGHGRDDNLATHLDASMRNVELKARDPDPARTLERALALGAEDRGEIRQRDTYFAGARGRLKLREQQTGGPRSGTS